jgi:secreted trypsin-like serine protease
MFSVTNQQCALLYSGTRGQDAVTDEMLCLIAANNAGVCSGDSGSPIILRGNVIGVCSWTLRPCGIHPSVYIRLSSHMRWIQQYI